MKIRGCPLFPLMGVLEKAVGNYRALTRRSQLCEHMVSDSRIVANLQQETTYAEDQSGFLPGGRREGSVS